MEYIDALRIIEQIGEDSVSVRGEANTKRVLIEPVLTQIMGYTMPSDITMEYSADVGVKEGEKVDYAIKTGDTIGLLVEAKDLREVVETRDYLTQLYRYYTVTDAVYGIITNGIIWDIYADKDKENIMDLEPIYTIDMRNYTERDHAVLCSLAKATFDRGYLRELYKNMLLSKAWERNRVLSEYSDVLSINAYINSEQFVYDIMDKCSLGSYTVDKVKDMLKSVMNGSYLLKYAKIAQVGNSCSFIDVYNDITKIKGIAIKKVTYTEVKRSFDIVDLVELPYAVLMLIRSKVSYSNFDTILSKQADKKSWLRHRSLDDSYDIGFKCIDDYVIENPKTVKDAIKRSMQLIKLFKINPIWFVLEE